MRTNRGVLREVRHRRVMAARDPLLEQRRVRVIDVARAEMHDSLRACKALDRRPDLREFRGHRQVRRRTNVATSGLHRMRMGGMAPIPRLTYINTPPAR